MKVIAVNGSPHKNGTSAKAISIISAELAKENIETEIIEVGGELIHGCIGCGSCRKTGACVFGDDIVNSARERVNAADGVILASPTYYSGIAGTYKCFLDRLFYSGVRLQNKPGVIAATVRRAGAVPVFQQLNNYLNLAGAITVPNLYWPVLYGTNAAET